MKVLVNSIDSGTSESHSFTTEIFALDGESVLQAYMDKSFDPEAEEIPHVVAYFEVVDNHANFVFHSDDPHFGKVSVVGIVYVLEESC